MIDTGMATAVASEKLVRVTESGTGGKAFPVQIDPDSADGHAEHGYADGEEGHVVPGDDREDAGLHALKDEHCKGEEKDADEKGSFAWGVSENQNDLQRRETWARVLELSVTGTFWLDCRRARRSDSLEIGFENGLLGGEEFVDSFFRRSRASGPAGCGCRSRVRLWPGFRRGRLRRA